MSRLSPRGRAAGALLAILAVAVAVTGCGGGGGEAKLGNQVEPQTSATATTSPVPTTTTTPPAWQSQIAQAKVPSVPVFAEPGQATPVMEFPNPWVYDESQPDQTIPQVFLVKEKRPDGWIRVLLPVRPNGSTGWIRASDVTVTTNPYRIEVSLGEHRIRVTRATDVVYEGTVAIGKPSTPTPVGEFYLRILIQSIDPTSVYGPFAYGLSSHSETLETFAGGEAQVGIHGNNDASVLGSDVTSGCIRIDNDAITMLSSQLPLGTPVQVVA
jgi:lipoprotein-anchoring transpeptidase ErfK/SrfK